MYETAVAAGWDKHRKTVVDVCVGESFLIQMQLTLIEHHTSRQ